MAANLSTFIKKLRDIMRQDPGVNGDAQRIEQIAWPLFLKVYATKEENWMLFDAFHSTIDQRYRWDSWGSSAHSDLTGDDLLYFVNQELFPELRELAVPEGEHSYTSIVRDVFEDANNYMKDGVLLRQVLNVIDELDLNDPKELVDFGAIYESFLLELQSAGSAGEFYTPRAVTDFMAKMINPQIGEKCADFACGTGGFLTSWLRELNRKLDANAKASKKDRREVANSIYGIEKKQLPFMLCAINMLLHGIETPLIYHGNSLAKDVKSYGEADKFDVVLMNPPYGGTEKADIKGNFPSDVASSETADLFMSVIMYRLKKTGRAAVILPDGFLFGTDGAKVAIKKRLTDEFNLHTIVRLPHSVFAPYTSITTNILFFDGGSKTSSTWFYRLDMPEGYKNFSKTKPMKLEHFNPAIEWWNRREALVVDGFDKAREYTLEELAARNFNLDLCGYPHEEEEILPPKDLIRQYKEKRASINAEIDRVLAEITEILGIDLEEENEE